MPASHRSCTGSATCSKWQAQTRCWQMVCCIFPRRAKNTEEIPGELPVHQWQWSDHTACWCNGPWVSPCAWCHLCGSSLSVIPGPPQFPNVNPIKHWKHPNLGCLILLKGATSAGSDSRSFKTFLINEHTFVDMVSIPNIIWHGQGVWFIM